MRESTNALAASQTARILVVSYFIALAFGLIQGAEISRLASPFLSDVYASIGMGALVVLLSAMILTGLFRRPAALVLSLIVFWASYMTLFAQGDINGFWRDLALIGGLLISAGVGQGLGRAAKEEAQVKTKAKPEPQLPKMPEQSNTASARMPVRRATISRFREDLSIARDG